MNYSTDSAFIMMIFVIPLLFGLSLLGEGVYKLMSYDRRGWVGVLAGIVFLVVVLVAYFLMRSEVI